MECILDPLYQSSHSSVASLASLWLWKVMPCSRSTLSDPNSVSEQALSQQLPLRLMEAFIGVHSTPIATKTIHRIPPADTEMSNANHSFAQSANTEGAGAFRPLKRSQHKKGLQPQALSQLGFSR